MEPDDSEETAHLELLSCLASSPSTLNLRSTHAVRGPRGLSSAAASAATLKRPHRPGRSLDTLSYALHPCMYMSSAERRLAAAGVARPCLCDLCNPALEKSSLARFWCSARLASTQPKAHASARCSPSNLVDFVLGSSGCVSDGAMRAAALMRCDARELRASRRRSPVHPRLDATGSAVVGS